MVLFARTMTFVVAIASLGSFAVAVPTGVGPLTFADEFDGTVLNPAKWFHRSPGPRANGVVSPTAVSLAGGVLTIKAYSEENPITHELTHVSGQIASQFLFEQQYGYFESRARFHTTSGTASAFWLQSPTFGQPIGDPENAGVEMDIFEHRFNDRANPANILDRVNGALIWDGYGADNKLRLKLSDPLPGLANDTWHTYGLRWAPDGYTFYYDGVPIWDGDDAPISRRSQFIILSIGVDEAFAGPAPPLGYGTLENTTTDVQFDYVRAYAIPEPGSIGALAFGAMIVFSRRMC